MAQAEVGDFDLLLNAAQDNAFFAPVKLQRIACRKIQPDKSITRTGSSLLQIADSETLSAIGPRTMVER